ncbi:DUF2163 domain-containing protein [Pseudohoeflea coraliihabitans]|uniref:DUF2163 domain-containing protein n=1 Tax=Pseudohoeflea coraliihabitans TaxID=2860393 RepID=A0ABS6WUD1_9HYPH|nr:DUF2163 domain-containing protein [Pseudohoeflea sp. DP4N28-3]
MKLVPQPLADHLAGAATTTCHAWRLTRRDGLVLGFSEHDRDLAFDATLFRAATGFDGSEVETALGLSADASDVLGAFSAEAITRDDLLAGRYDGALVETFLVNWQAPEDHILLSTRELGEVRAGPLAFRAELRSLAARLDQVQGRIYARHCDAVLGDGRCRFDLEQAGFGATASVLAAVGDDVLTSADLGAFADGWFSNGRITFVSGALAGLEFALSDHRLEAGVATLTLWSASEMRPMPGDAFTIHAGCDKRRETCRDKFDNLLNFQGFPFMPGSDFAYGYADEDSVHDGRPIVL